MQVQSCAVAMETCVNILELPQNLMALSNEIRRLRSNNPNEQDSASLKPREKLISYIYSSMKIKRSQCHTAVVLMGNSGAGKSATINHLFGTNIAKTSDSASETRQTTEFIIRIQHTSLEAILTLGIIDTPGLNDTNGGICQDACNLVSIKRFFNSHERLRGCFPNVILIIIAATDQ